MSFPTKSAFRFNRVVIFALFAISSLIISEYLLGRLTIGVDQLRQYEVARFLISGEGLSKAEINFNDLSSPRYTTLTAFPPGISVIVSPLFLISDDIRIVHLIFSLSNLIIFLLSTIYLLKIITKNNLSSLQLSLVYFFIAINGTYTVLAGNSDLVNLNLVILSILFILKWYSSKKRSHHIVLASFFTVLTVYFRYAYFPVLLTIPIFFLSRTLLFKTGEWKQAFISTLSVLIFSIPVLGHIFHINSQTGYIQDKAGGGFQLYWENLERVSPFPVHGFFDVFPFLRAIGYGSKYGYDRGYSYPDIIDYIFYFGSILILTPLLIYAIKLLKGRFTNSSTFILFWFGFIVSTALILLVYTGSLINPSQYTAYNWSWVKIFRYFIVPVYFIHLGYFLILFRAHQKFWRLFVAVVVGLSILYSASLKAYNYTANYIPFDFYHNITFIGSNNMQLNSYRLHRSLPSGKEHFVVLYSRSLQQSLYNPKYFFSLNNATSSVIRDEMPNLITSETVKVFVITTMEDANAHALIDKYNGEKFDQINTDTSIYQFTLHPS